MPVFAALLALAGWATLAAGAEAAPGKSPYAAWTNGPSADDAFFPVAVWLQSPTNLKTE